VRSAPSRRSTTVGAAAEPPTRRRARNAEIRRDGQVPGASDEILSPMVVALLRPGRGRHADDHRQFARAAQLFEGDAGRLGVTTTHAGKCRMSGGSSADLLAVAAQDVDGGLGRARETPHGCRLLVGLFGGRERETAARSSHLVVLSPRWYVPRRSKRSATRLARARWRCPRRCTNRRTGGLHP
jgi:hypothetical protein